MFKKKQNIKKSHLIALFFLVGIISVPAIAFGQISTGSDGVLLEVGIGSYREATDLIDYITKAYQFLISASGILAACMIVFHGSAWILAAGGSEAITNAKAGITSALTGLGIALFSFFLLNTINPELVTFEFAMPELNFSSFCDECGGVEGSCDFGIALASKSPDLAKLYTYTSSVKEKCMDKELFDYFVKALERLEKDSRYDDMTFDVSSVFRSSEKQRFLYECYLNKRETGDCAEGCGSCNPANNPDSSNPSAHQQGKAIDIGWSPTRAAHATTRDYKSTAGLKNSVWHDFCMVGMTNKSMDKEISYVYPAKVYSISTKEEFEQNRAGNLNVPAYSTLNYENNDCNVTDSPNAGDGSPLAVGSECIYGSCVDYGSGHQCVTEQNFYKEYDCNYDLYLSVYTLNQLMDNVGINHVSNEWWHHDTVVANSTAGEYKQNDSNFRWDKVYYLDTSITDGGIKYPFK